MTYAGEIAALATALCYALSSLGFAAAGPRVGAFVVNLVRIVIATVLLGALHLMWVGNLWPDLTQEQAGWLVISGVVGLALGDVFYFTCLSRLGPRLGTLLMGTFPVFTVFGEGLFLGDWPHGMQWGGIALVLLGVALVLSQRREAWRPEEQGQLSRGVFVFAVVCGLLGALGQGGGMILARLGMEDAATGERVVDALSATLVRMYAGLAGVLLLGLPRLLRPGQGESRHRRLLEPRIAAAMCVGILFGPTCGVWLNQVAVKYAQTGIAATLIATTPVMMIPIGFFAYGSRPTRFGVLGTVVAAAGAMLLLLE